MRMNDCSLAVFLATAAFLATGALAQQTHHGSPYAGQQARDIKALSEPETRELLEGAGMGHAKAAELNRYPGPLHALENAERLGLSPEQKQRIASILSRHKAEARSIGAEVVELERQLDRLFAERKADDAGIDALSGRIGATLGRLRASHLKAHVETTSLLTPAQADRYVEARGYGKGSSAAHHHHR
jgi:hypothetical protein